MKKNIVIVGGGIAGLMSAYILSENDNYEITLIEQENEVGGLLKKFDYGEYGVFDFGMHNVLQTSIKELDDLIYNLLPEDEWQVLEGNQRDLVGLYVNGDLQINSPYIDLRKFEKYDEFLIDFFKNFSPNTQDINDYKSVQQFLYDRYGKKITENVLKDIVEKFYHTSISELDPLATLVTPLGRVILFDEFLMKELNKSDILKSKLGYPEQRNLELSLSSGRKAFYPKNYGIHKIVDSLVDKLEKKNVKILCNSQITKLNCHDKIDSIQINNNQAIDNIDKFIWSGNLFSLSKLLGIEHSGEYDKPPKTTVTNILIDKKLNRIEDVYYIYCYDKNMSTFRVTPYYNYCEGSKRAGGYPVAIEMLIYEDIDDIEKITSQAIQEIKKMGLVDENANILFRKSEVLKNGFPRPTINNMNAITNIRNKIQNKKITNMINIGILAEKNLFFQTDILIDLFNKLNKRAI